MSTAKTSGIMTVSKAYMNCIRMVKESLMTHKNLDEEDVRFASRIICGSKLTDEQLAAFLLHTSKETNVGRFALTFNYQLDMSIKERNADMVYGLAIAPVEKVFIELYHNEELTPVERQTVTKMYNREYTAIINTVYYVNQNHQSLEGEGILPCETTKISSSNGRTTLYDRCYRGVCIFEAKKDGREIMPGAGSSKIPDKVYVPEKTAGQEVHRVHCFDVLQLVSSAAQDIPINPITGEPFSPDALSLIFDKYGKEIKLYRYHLKKLAESGY